VTLSKTTPTPPAPRVDIAKLAELIASLVIGHIRERVETGIDVDGKPMMPYSDEYQEARNALGRNTTPVDLTMTGGMINSVAVVERTPDSITIGVGTGTSRQVRPPTKGNRRKRRGERRGPPHNLLAKWHQNGEGNNPRRRWFGVSPKGDREIRAEVARRKPPLK
jgi:hypothetical protein